MNKAQRVGSENSFLCHSCMYGPKTQKSESEAKKVSEWAIYMGAAIFSLIGNFSYLKKIYIFCKSEGASLLCSEIYYCLLAANIIGLLQKPSRLRFFSVSEMIRNDWRGKRILC